MEKDGMKVVETRIDNGMAELYIYIKMRQEAENYLLSHPGAIRAFKAIQENSPGPLASGFRPEIAGLTFKGL